MTHLGSFEVKAPSRSGSEYLILISGIEASKLTAIRIYLNYNASQQISKITKISVTDQGKTTEFVSFEDIYAGLLMILTALNQ